MSTGLVLILAPMLSLTVAATIWKTAAGAATTSEGHAFERPISNRRPPETRVLWMIFDEMDHKVAFETIPPVVNLPAFDRLRAESFVATNAVSPSHLHTILSVPSLMTGRVVTRADPIGIDDVALTFAQNDARVRWSGQPSVFSRAQELGFETSVVGWYLPYCRVFAHHLTRCSWATTGGAFDNVGLAGHAILGYQLLTALSTVPFAVRLVPSVPATNIRQSHIAAYTNTASAAHRAVADRHLGLTFVHWPVPHRPFVYDREHKDLTVADGATYFDNLALADRAFGELRAAMERAGTWANTTILISADHSWRAPHGPMTTVDPRVPFMLKLASRPESFDYKKRFNTLVTHDLVLALLRGDIRTATEVAKWIDERSEPESLPGS